MENFQYYTPTKVVFGKGTEDLTGELVKAQGCRKVLVHYGSGSVVRSGLLDRIFRSLDAAGIDYISLGGVVPNPRLSLVYEGIDLCKKEKVDFILAVGGGSVIDSEMCIRARIKGADVFIGVSAPGTLTQDMVRSMAKDPIIFACANPTPEIFPDEAKAAGAAVVSTGRSDFPNQVNNVLCFPGIFRGALDVRASEINDEMKVAAAYAIAGLVSDEELNPEYILPAAFDPRVKDAVAKATAEAARKSGVARI